MKKPKYMAISFARILKIPWEVAIPLQSFGEGILGAPTEKCDQEAIANTRTGPFSPCRLSWLKGLGMCMRRSYSEKL